MFGSTPLQSISWLRSAPHDKRSLDRDEPPNSVRFAPLHERVGSQTISHKWGPFQACWEYFLTELTKRLGIWRPETGGGAVRPQAAAGKWWGAA